MKELYLVTVISVTSEIPCEHENVPFLNKEDAVEYFEKVKNEWLEDTEKYCKFHDEDFDMDKWIEVNLHHDIDADDYKCFHYIYDDGAERIFELKKYEI